MSADFFFQDPTFEIQSLKAVAVFKWQHIPDEDVRYSIATEEQYLCFHMYMLKNLRHTQAGQIDKTPYVKELGLSVRAGAIKAAVLVSASIVEAALRAIAEKRKYPLNSDPKRRTLGNVIRAWEKDGKPRQEVAAIWTQVKAMHEVRNFVHLHKAAKDTDADWAAILSNEEALLSGAQAAINHVSRIEA